MSELMQNAIQNNARPLVTVAMPVYNAGNYLRLAVLSIIKQTFTDWEMLIIDDGSTDNAIDTILDINDKRIRIISDSVNKGLAARLNEAIDLAHGQYFARMDQDDVSFPERFKRQVEVLQNEPMLDLVGIRPLTINDNDELTGVLACADSNDKICAKPWLGISMPHPTWMGKISWFRKNRYATPAPYFCEDQELLLRTFENSHFFIINEELFAYRIRDSISLNKLIKTRLTILKVQLECFMDRGQLYFYLRALVSFAGKIILDILKAFNLVSYPIVKQGDLAAEKRWSNILNYITGENN